MNTLSIHYGHDSNISLLKNGKIILAISEERISRIKNDGNWPKLSINLIKKKYPKLISNINKVYLIGNKTFSEFGGGSLFSFLKKNNLLIFSYILIPLSLLVNLLDNLYLNLRLRNKLICLFLFIKVKIIFGINVEINFIDHHTSHAHGAVSTSPYKDGLAITLDGKGDFLSGSFFVFKNKKLIKRIYTISDYDSIGFVYSQITKYLGFTPNKHEGKITGLAAHGNIKKIQHLDFPLKFNHETGQITNSLINQNTSNLTVLYRILKINFFTFLKVLFFNSNLKTILYKILISEYIENNLKKLSKEDLSAYAQHNLENLVIKIIKFYQDKYGKYSIALSGGIFANVKLNQRIKENVNKNLYIFPGMDDGGLSLGTNVYFNCKKNFFFENIYFGPDYNNQEIIKILKKNKFKYEYFKDIESKIANLLFNKKIVGRFYGKMEWGPRALGNRSILAAPFDERINDNLNKRLRRTEFMPFAPTIIFEYAKNYIINYSKKDISADFMTTSYYVNKIYKKKIKAVTHIDGSARPQILKYKCNYSFYKIIKEFYKLSGVPVVLNTSFNLHEEPIVMSPDDSLKALVSDAIDVLAINNFLVYNSR
jgi:carbamoyltransferase